MAKNLELSKEERDLVEVKKYNKKKRHVWDRRLFVFSFLFLPILFFLIFYVYVNFQSFFYSFMRFEGGEGHFDPNFTNYKEIIDCLFLGKDSSISILTSANLRNSLVNVLLFNFVGIFLGLPISIFFGYFLYKKIKGYKYFRFVIYLPSIITSSALIMLYKQIIGEGGLLHALSGQGFDYVNPWLRTDGSSIYFLLFYCLIFGFGTNMIVINGAMNSINKEVIEASELDGCNWFKELIYIIFPSIWPTISTILIMCVAGFLGTSGPLLAYTGIASGNMNQTFTLSYLLYYMVARSPNFNEGWIYMASAIGICMTIVSFPAALIVKRIAYGKEK